MRVVYVNGKIVNNVDKLHADLQILMFCSSCAGMLQRLDDRYDRIEFIRRKNNTELTFSCVLDGYPYFVRVYEY